VAFTKEDIKSLEEIRKRMHKQFQYTSDEKRWRKSEHWESDDSLHATIEQYATVKGDCEEFARGCMYLANKESFMARLVVGHLQGVGHCWVEIMDREYKDAIYMDNNYRKLLVKKELIQHDPIAASPWNPYPGDKRNWVEVKK